MMLLFEGVDKSGKSTLIKKFVELSHCSVFKNTIKPTQKMYSRGFVSGTYFGAYEAAKKTRDLIIFDRSHITELVYAKLKRGYRPDKTFWKEWEKDNRSFAVIVYIDTPVPDIKKRFKSEKEEYVKISEIIALKQEYSKFLKKTTLRLIYIDGSRPKDQLLDQLTIQLLNLNIWTSLTTR